MKALILGHSFVKRAGLFVKQGREDTSQHLHLQDVSVVWTGYSGITVPFLELKSHILFAVKLNILVLDIGSNDLADSSVIPSKLARQVYSLALHFLKVARVQCIFIVDICPRATQAWYPARRISMRHQTCIIWH